MKKCLAIFVTLFVLVGCSSLVIADDLATNAAPTVPEPMHSKAPDHTVYLKGDDKQWKEFPPKPALGSSIDEADLIITLSAQANRTEEQKAEAMHDKPYSITLVTEFIDPTFETKYPNVFAMLKLADNDEHFIGAKIKNVNERPRPYVQHPLLVTSLFTVKDYSYPSGHASGSELQARLLGVLFPDKAADLIKRARQVADSRVVAGVHYASDVEAGQNLGDMLFDALEANDKFKQDFAAAAAKDGIPIK